MVMLRRPWVTPTHVEQPQFLHFCIVLCITHSHGSASVDRASVVRTTIKVNGKSQNLTPRHP